MKKRLSGFFKKGSSSGKGLESPPKSLSPPKPTLNRGQLAALEHCLRFLNIAIEQQAQNDGGDPLPLHLYTSFGDSYVGEASSRGQVQELEDAVCAGEGEGDGAPVARLLAQRVRNKDLSTHFVALAVRNVLLDHAPLCSYEAYAAILASGSPDTKQWTSLLAPVHPEHKHTLLLVLTHLQTMATAAETKKLAGRGVTLDSLLLAVAPLLLNDDPADRDTQMAQKARIGNDITDTGGSSSSTSSSSSSKKARENAARSRVLRVKQLLQSDFHTVLAVPPSSSSSAGAGGSLQSRSVRVTFPRLAEEDANGEKLGCAPAGDSPTDSSLLLNPAIFVFVCAYICICARRTGNGSINERKIVDIW